MVVVGGWVTFFFSSHAEERADRPDLVPGQVLKCIRGVTRTLIKDDFARLFQKRLKCWKKCISMALVMSKIVTTNTFEIVFNHIYFIAIVLCSWTHLKHNNIHKHTHTLIHTQNILIFLFLMFESPVRIVLKICLERQLSFLSLANGKWPKLIPEPVFLMSCNDQDKSPFLLESLDILRR